MIAVLLLAATSTTIGGAVHDSSGRGVAGALVIVQSASGAETQTLTGPQGRFAIEASERGDLTLRVRAGGFAEKTQRVTVAELSKPVLVVLAGGTLIDGVTLTAATLESLPGLTLDDQLKTVPGFSLYRRWSSRATDPPEQTVTLRGLAGATANRSTVVVDGVPLNDAFAGWVDWNRVPLTAVDRVEVWRGGASDAYGSGAAGGVIQIVTDAPSRASARIAVDAWSLDVRRASMWAGAAPGHLNGFASGEWQHDDGFIPVARSARGPIDTSVANRYKTFYGSAGARLGAWQTTLRGQAFSETRDGGTPLTGGDAVAGSFTGEVTGTAGGRLWLARGYGRLQTYNETFSSVNAARTTEFPTVRQHLPSSSAGLTVQTSGLRGPASWTIGAEGTFDEGRSDDTRSPSGVVTSMGGARLDGAVFARAIVAAADRVTLSGSVRGDYWVSDTTTSVGARTRDRTVSPKASITWRASQMITLQGTGMTAFRAPTPAEMFRSVQAGDTLVTANDRLAPERLIGGDAAMLFNFAPSAIRVAGFWTEMDDAIVDVTVGSTPGLIVRQRRNAATIRARGAEIEEDVKLGSRLRLVLGEQFVDSTFRDAGDPALAGKSIPQLPTMSSSMRLQFNAPLDIIAVGEYRSAGTQYDDDRNLVRLDAASIFDGSVSLPINSHARLIGAVENILDKSYDVRATPVAMIGAPRMVRVGIRISLP